MTIRKYKIVCSYLFSSIEIVMLLFLLLFVSLGIPDGNLQSAIVVFQSIFWATVLLEGIYFFRVIKKGRGFASLPFTLLLYYQYNVIEGPYLYQMVIPALYKFCFCLILCSRIFATLYLYKMRGRQDGYSYKGVLWTTVMDLIYIFRYGILGSII